MLRKYQQRLRQDILQDGAHYLYVRATILSLIPGHVLFSTQKLPSGQVFLKVFRNIRVFDYLLCL